MRTEINYLLKLVNCVVFNKPNPKSPRELDWSYLYNVAKNHGIANIVYYGMDLLGFKPPKPIEQKLTEQNRISVFAEAQQEIETNNILSLLEENKIRAIILKGPVIRKLYPRPDMRSMVDVDILVDEENLEALKGLMREKGYKLLYDGGNHDVYIKKPLMTVEFHRSLIYERLDERLHEYYKNPWSFVVPMHRERYIHEFSVDNYYVYMLAHTAKHFKHGGCGIRAVIDLRVYLNYYNGSLDWNYINAELEKCGLKKFNDTMMKLSDVWFCGAKKTAFYDELTDFIIESGSLGTQKHSMTSKIRSASSEGSVSGAKIRQALTLMFPSAAHMKTKYPWLEGRMYLIPVAYLIRAVSGVIGKRRSLRTIMLTMKVDKDQVNSMDDLFSKLEI